MEFLKRVSDFSLRLAARAYGGLTALDRATRRSQRLPYPTVSVGNIAVGGRAKTPMTVEVCRRLKDRGFRPVVLTRGYGRVDARALWLRPTLAPEAPSEILDLAKNEILAAKIDRAALAGDEALEISEEATCDVLVGARRAENAQAYLRIQATERPEGVRRTVFVLDDGFQHWSLERDLDIVMVRAEDFTDSVLPRGRLREKPEALKRADLVLELGRDVFKRSRLPENFPSDDEAAKQELLVVTTRAPDPDFLLELERVLGARPFRLLTLADHADARTMRAALAPHAGPILVGGKEHAKLAGFEDLKLVRLHLDLEFGDGGARLERAFDRLMGGRAP
jgi:tetraacyldisaccharide 4'-kinase